MHITRGNVFDDLGLSPERALELKIKADILIAISAHIERKGYTQKEVGKLLGIHQPDASRLVNGKISGITVDKLLRYAGKLNLGAEIRVTDPGARKRTVGKTAKATAKSRKVAYA